MKISFTLSKINEINLRKYQVFLKDYKVKVKKIVDILFSLEEIKSSKIFKDDIRKIRFDLSFCNNKTIQEINKNYRNKDSITDVITFSLFCDDENSIIYRKTADLGQIIISIDRAYEQKTKTLEFEILTLITHGILHLLGFDHLEKKDYDFVINIQNIVMGKIFKE